MDREKAERDLFKTRDVPMSRKQRRAIAKRAGVRFSEVNQVMQHPAPVYLGIRQFKKNTQDKKLVQTYKDNAHQSKIDLDIRRAQEALHGSDDTRRRSSVEPV